MEEFKNFSEGTPEKKLYDSYILSLEFKNFPEGAPEKRHITILIIFLMSHG